MCTLFEETGKITKKHRQFHNHVFKNHKNIDSLPNDRQGSLKSKTKKFQTHRLIAKE